MSGGRQHRVTSRVVAALPEPVSLALPPVLRPRHVIAAHLTSQQALKHGDCQTAWPRPASSPDLAHAVILALALSQGLEVLPVPAVSVGAAQVSRAVSVGVASLRLSEVTSE